MSAERIRRAEARRLVLVRGGKDGGDGGDRDDLDFYRRIGWQTGAPEPDDDFERRIAEGLFAKAAAPSNVVDIDRARDARSARSHDFEAALADMLSRALMEPAPDSGPRRKEIVAEEPNVTEDDARRISGIHVAVAVNPHVETRPATGRRTGRILGVAAAALALAASVTFVVVKTRGAGTNMDVASSAARAIAPDPSVAHEIEEAYRDSDPSPTAPVVTAPKDDEAAPPKKGPRARPPVVHAKKPVPPGMVVARRSQDSRRRDESDSLTLDRLAARDALDSDAPTSVRTGREQDISARPGFASLRSPLAGWSDRRTAWSPAGDGVEPSPSWRTAPRPSLTLPGVDGAVTASVDAAQATWSSVPTPVDGAAGEKTKEPVRSSSAAWSLAGAKDRWVGASISPSPESLSAANVGAVLQLDVGKALDRL